MWGGGRTAPGDTLQGVTPEWKNVAEITKKQWTNEVGQVKKVRDDTLQGVDTRLESKKSGSDKQKGRQFSYFFQNIWDKI